MTPSQLIHAIHDSTPSPLCSDLPAFVCWVCGGPSTRGAIRWKWAGANFTGQNRVRCPASDHVCEACIVVMAGKPPNTERMWTHLVDGREHVRVNKGSKPVMRAFLRRKHTAPWFAAIADSGQKHIIPWAPVNAPHQPGGAVLFEESLVELPRDAEGWALLDEIAEALTDGLTKEEIGRGEYGPRAWTLLGAERMRALEDAWSPLRGSSWFDLATWLAQRDEEKVAARLAAEKEAKRGRQAKGARKNAHGGVSARDPGGVPQDAGMQHPEALGSAQRPNARRRADERKPGGVANDHESNAAARSAAAGQLSLLPGSG